MSRSVAGPGNGTNHERDSGTSRIADQAARRLATSKQGGKIIRFTREGGQHRPLYWGPLGPEQ